MNIDKATIEDLPGISRLRNDAISNTLAVWHDEPSSEAETQAWFCAQQAAGLPILVMRDAEGVVGYANYWQFRPRAGYKWTAELKIYMREDARGKGLGKQLLSALLKCAKSKGVRMMIAGIESSNVASIGLHQSLGFVETGRLPEVGFKFDKWLTLVLMQKKL